jgi:hypothetical protein
MKEVVYVIPTEKEIARHIIMCLFKYICLNKAYTNSGDACLSNVRRMLSGLKLGHFLRREKIV